MRPPRLAVVLAWALFTFGPTVVYGLIQIPHKLGCGLGHDAALEPCRFLTVDWRPVLEAARVTLVLQTFTLPVGLIAGAVGVVIWLAVRIVSTVKRRPGA